jgi:dTDP-4-dehydrorhamnose reductase
MANKVLIIGATGLLGSVLYKKFQISEQVVGTYFRPRTNINKKLIFLDATDPKQLSGLVRDLLPSTIINCMGLASVEMCELRPEASWKLNTEIPLRLAQISSQLGIRLIHFSTDHYKSEKDQPRKESDSVVAINQYGNSKLQAERIIREHDTSALILRTNFFGRSRYERKSLLDFALMALESKNRIVGFEDVFFSPMGAHEIANFLLDKSSNSIQGTLNLASRQVISKFDFLTLVARIQGKDEANVFRGSIANSDLSVVRPKYLALNPSLMIHETGYEVPTIEKMLRTEIYETP